MNTFPYPIRSGISQYTRVSLNGYGVVDPTVPDQPVPVILAGTTGETEYWKLFVCSVLAGLTVFYIVNHNKGGR